MLWLWHISCLCCSKPSKINKGLVNHQVLGDWQVWEAVDEEGMPVLPRCRGCGERANHNGGRAGKTRWWSINQETGAKKRGVWTRMLISARRRLSPFSLSFLPSSLPLLPTESRHWATAIALLTVATEREARKSSLTAAGFEGHLKNTSRRSRDRLHFQITPGNQSPVPLSLSITSRLLPFDTTAKSIEMTELLEGHSWAQPALWWNALQYVARRTRWKNKYALCQCLSVLFWYGLAEMDGAAVIFLYSPRINMQNGAAHWCSCTGSLKQKPHCFHKPSIKYPGCLSAHKRGPFCVNSSR